MPETSLPHLTLVIGGAASGKSSEAERLVVESGLARTYVATAQIFDDEMRAKVAAHLDMRGADWTTVEEPLDLAPVLAAARMGEVVLIDCATLWLTNHILADNEVEAAADALLAALDRCAAPVVIVSNEVGAGIVPENALARRFRNAQGRLNQRIAAQADRVITVIAGLPLVLKGAAR
jgi:adenosylcobinamide kinase/adenosylcobinamide-phosphate guanylyltransferase